MKKVKQILSGFLIIAVIFSAGFFSGYFYESDQEEIIKKPIYTNIINRDVKKMTPEFKNIELNCYYKSPFILDINKIKGKNNYQITGSLCDRQASRDINIPVASNGNINFYIGLGIGFIGAGLLIYGTYKIIK